MIGSQRHWILACLALTLAPWVVQAGDWPHYRYDAQRSAASPDELPDNLAVNWVRALPPLKPAWPDQPKMQFDVAYEPIVVGQRLIVGSSFDDSITAYDTRTGKELWKRFAEGPIRFAPAAWEDRIYVACDDGYLWCLRAEDGAVAWKFRGGPSERKILGNERMISTWPARGAPVIADGKVYFAAGIWPFMGVFLHALDARTGAVLWTNDGDGSIYIKQPHNTDSFAGVAPQGPLVVSGDKLLVPGGRSAPACYDRATGKFLYYQLAENGKRGGGSTVAATHGILLNGGAAFELNSEKYLGEVGDHLAFAGGRLYDGEDDELRMLDLTTWTKQESKSVDRKGVVVKSLKWTIKTLAEADAPPITALIQAGDRLYLGSEGRVVVFDLPLSADGESEPAQEYSLAGTPSSLIAGDDRLFASTREGRIYCFAGENKAANSPVVHARPTGSLPADKSAAERVESLLSQTGVSGGYCLLWGGASAPLVSELLRQSRLNVVIVEPDPPAAVAMRDALREAGISGERASVLTADLQAVDLPPYFASLALVGSLPTTAEERAATVAKIFASLRPFGGVACLPLTEDADLKTTALPGAVWKTSGAWTFLSREGPLPDSADWTHEHADAANTRVSKDKRVKAPLGLLWFGGSSNESILPRHGHGPQPQVVDGRLFIEGMDLLRAMDIYTGRVLWEAPLPGVGSLYNNTSHQPGANASGTNYIAASDGVYVAYRNSCVRLDPVTGRKLFTFSLPIDAGEKDAPQWGYINVSDDFLVGGADPLFNPGLTASKGENDNHAFSRQLVVMNRHTGKVLWTARARNGFRHNAICIGGGRLYAIDQMSGPEKARLKRRGEEAPLPPKLTVFDLASGKQLWSTEKDVFGTWLSYSAERDVLVEAGRVARDTISDEPKGMRAYSAARGKMLWESKTLAGPAMLHHDTILMADKACDLLTGAPKLRAHPLSGEPVEWTWSRNYGCNTPLASEHLLTFRSGAAGYFDLCRDGGTGNFGGFRSSCTNNLIVAGGLITAPDYTRSCTCSYQNQTSMALVPMPDAEIWTSFGSQPAKQPVRRLGLNLGAPGDRRTDDGLLWLEYPSVGGASPPVEVKTTPTKPEWFRRHSSQVSGPGLSWVASSGAKGLTELEIKLADKDAAERGYTVRLHFLEPDDLAAGERVFSVRVQGKMLAPALDVVREAGGRNRSLVKELTGVRVRDQLLIELSPQAGVKVPAAVLSGVEIQAEGW